MRAFGAAETDIKIVLVEVAVENWGLGGRPASEIELGFEINV
jgi:phenylpyruvate tautomerase PptA (4-oxalocrotonate tautomerase family)